MSQSFFPPCWPLWLAAANVKAAFFRLIFNGGSKNLFLKPFSKNKKEQKRLAAVAASVAACRRHCCRLPPPSRPPLPSPLA
jgi:hypothetical protein